MRDIHRILLLTSAAGIGVLAGLALRPGPKPVADGNDEMARPRSGQESTFHARFFSRPGRDRVREETPRERQERELTTSSGIMLRLRWLEALESAPLDDYPRLARFAKGDDALLRLLATRWIDLAPRHLFDTIFAAEKSGARFPQILVDRLQNEWTRRDPKAVIKALSDAPEFGARFSWRNNVAVSLINHDPELGLRMMSEWHIEHFGPRMNEVAKWAAADPRHAAVFALEHPAGFATELTMKTIGSEWAKQSPRDALAFASGTNGKYATQMAEAALQTWAQSDMKRASEWLSTTDGRTRNRLVPAFMEIWAKQDAAAALAWAQENLTGFTLAQSVNKILTGAASKSLPDAAELVDTMPPSTARREAAAAVAKKWFPEHSDTKPAAPEAIAWLTGLDSASIERALRDIRFQWSRADPHSLAEFLVTSGKGLTDASAFTMAARALGQRSPMEGIGWAARLPQQQSLSAGGAVFTEWWSAQPSSAMNWLLDLPKSDPRRSSYFEHTLGSISYDPASAKRIAMLNEAGQAEARATISRMKIQDDRRQTLLNALGKK